MADKLPSSHFGDMQASWRSLARAFTYQHATISEAELLSQHAKEIVEWSKSEQLIEVADEDGRLRLTPQGRRMWRDATGQA